MVCEGITIMPRQISKGLQAYNQSRTAKKLAKKEKELQDDLEQLEGMDMDDQKRVDTYVIKLSQKHPDDVKVANALIKWVSDKRKTNPEKNLLDADV